MHFLILLNQHLSLSLRRSERSREFGQISGDSLKCVIQWLGYKKLFCVLMQTQNTVQVLCFEFVLMIGQCAEFEFDIETFDMKIMLCYVKTSRKISFPIM